MVAVSTPEIVAGEGGTKRLIARFLFAAFLGGSRAVR
jgi:hypothetical protein